MTLREIQAPIKARYGAEPDSARITLRATGSTAEDVMSCSVDLGRALYCGGCPSGRRAGAGARPAPETCSWVRSRRAPS